MADEVLCTTASEFKAAIDAHSRRIRVSDAKLAKKVSAVMKVDTAAFLAAAGCIAVAVAIGVSWVTAPADVPATGGGSAVVRFGGQAAAVGGAAASVGLGSAMAMTALGTALGSVGLLKRMYLDYSIVERGNGFLVLNRK